MGLTEGKSEIVPANIANDGNGIVSFQDLVNGGSHETEGDGDFVLLVSPVVLNGALLVSGLVLNIMLLLFQEELLNL